MRFCLTMVSLSFIAVVLNGVHSWKHRVSSRSRWQCVFFQPSDAQTTTTHHFDPWHNQGVPRPTRGPIPRPTRGSTQTRGPQAYIFSKRGVPAAGKVKNHLLHRQLPLHCSCCLRTSVVVRRALCHVIKSPAFVSEKLTAWKGLAMVYPPYENLISAFHGLECYFMSLLYVSPPSHDGIRMDTFFPAHFDPYN